MSFLKHRTIVMCSLACLSIGTVWADQVVMKNGDRATGSIIKKDGKNVTIKTDQFGIVPVSWDQVETIRADKPVNIVLQDGKTVQGTVASAEGKLEVAGPDMTLRVTPAKVIQIIRMIY